MPVQQLQTLSAVSKASTIQTSLQFVIYWERVWHELSPAFDMSLNISTLFSWK